MSCKHLCWFEINYDLHPPERDLLIAVHEAGQEGKLSPKVNSKFAALFQIIQNHILKEYLYKHDDKGRFVTEMQAGTQACGQGSRLSLFKLHLYRLKLN